MELEKKKYGKHTKHRTRSAHKSENPRYIPSEIREQVAARNGEQCAFVTDDGQRCECRTALEFDHDTNAMAAFGNVRDLYFGGDLEAGIALSGQVAGRITGIRPVAEVIADCAAGCEATLAALAERYLDG